MTKPEPRFERRGGPPDLPAAFTAFVTGPLGGRSLDDRFNAESAEGEFPDFGVYRDLVLIEMKHLEADQQERIQAVLDEKVAAEEKPLFYGQRKVDINAGNFSNADEILQAILTKLNRSLESILSKANRQFRSYRDRHRRKNRLNICVILNSRLTDYTPEIVAYAIHTKMKLRDGEPQRFESIDAVLYISEKHFTQLPDGRAAHPITIYEGEGVTLDEWKLPIVHHVVQQWSDFRTGTPPEFAENLKGFGTVEDIPDRMTRSDAWLLEYARSPYLRGLSLPELRAHLHRTVVVNSLTFVIGSWPKPSREETAEGLRRFQHTIAEINRRGIDMREMAMEMLTDTDRANVFAGLPKELVDKLSGRGNSGTNSD